MLFAAGALGTDKMDLRDLLHVASPTAECVTIMELLYVLLKDNKNLRRPVGWPAIKKYFSGPLNMKSLDLSNLSQNQLNCLQEAAAMENLASIS